MNKKQKDFASSAIMQRDVILAKIAPNHNSKVVSDIAKQIAKFLEDSFPNTPAGTVALAMQLTTDRVILGMLEIK
jgi:hypothetical protein